MDPSVFVKLLCDMAVWFCATCVFFPVPCQSVYMPLTAAVCILSGTLASVLARKNAKLRFIALAPFVALFYLIFTADLPLDSIFVFGPPCIYAALLIVLERFYHTRYEFEAVFKPVCIALPAYMVLASIFGAGEQVLKTSLPLYIVFAVCGVVLLRMLRHDECVRREPRFIALNLAAPVLLCALAALMSTPAALAAMSDAMGFIYRHVIMPILMLCGYAFYGVIWLLEKLVRPLMEKAAEQEPTEIDFGNGLGEDIMDELTESAVDPVFETIFKALAAIAFIIAAVFIFKRLLGRRSQGGGTLSKDTRGTLPPDPINEGRRSIFRPRTPRETVRFYYARFMKRLEKYGVELPIYFTTAMISEAAAPFFPADTLERFRAIYVRARYSAAEITREDAKLARALYDELKSPERTDAKKAT